MNQNRRQFLRHLGVSATTASLVSHLPGIGQAAEPNNAKKQRLVFMFSPNGTVPTEFWPDETGCDFQLKPILQPLHEYQDRMLILRGISNRVRGDGDSHMRGMSCLLTGIELFPGNIQGGSDTPAGWASGISIDQEIANFFQSREATRTRFGSLEFGVGVPNRADPWTRWVYAGPNKPVAPVDDPYLMFEKMFGQMKDQETLQSVLDDVVEDLRRVKSRLGVAERTLLDDHLQTVREMELDIQAARQQQVSQQLPTLPAGVPNDNDSLPQLSKMQIDLLVNSFASDNARVATLQYTNSVGNARMRWLGIEEGHHQLSHDPDLNAESQEKLTKINTWFCGQLRHLVDSLASTPEPDGNGNLLDHTTIIWTNELGKGNSHTLNDIPFVLVGGGLGFRTGRSLAFDKAPHNRLHLSLAHAVGHDLTTFGKRELCEQGALSDLT